MIYPIYEHNIPLINIKDMYNNIKHAYYGGISVPVISPIKRSDVLTQDSNLNLIIRNNLIYH